MMPIYMIPLFIFRDDIIGETVFFPTLVIGFYSLVCSVVTWNIERKVRSYFPVLLGAVGYVVLFVYFISM